MPTRRSQSSSLALIAALVLGLIVAGPVAGTAPGSTDIASVESTQASPDIQTQSTPDTDTTTTRIAVRENGSAEWELTIRMALETDTDVEEFAAFQEEFEQNRTQYVGQFREQMTGVVENAAAATNREMTATAFEGETGVQEAPRRWGYVTYRFEWDGFAQTSEGTVTVGDVFRGGYFLSEDDILIIEGPGEYETESTDPNPDRQRSGELQYNGPASFENERPEAVFTDGSGTTDDGSNTPARGTSPLLFAVTGLVLVLVVAGLAYGRHWLPGSDEKPPGEQASEATTAPIDEAATSEPAVTDLDELATDEDQVVSLLESESGRIRQAEIADRLDWSPSKTSRVLSDLAEEGTIEKLRIGRENVIDLSDEQT